MNIDLEWEDRKLFEKVIRKWALRPDTNEGLTFKQIAAMVFGSGSAENARRVGRIINKFKEYFHLPRDGAWKCRVNWKNIARDYPQLLPGGMFAGDKQTRQIDPVQAMLRALDDEIRAVRDDIEQHPIRAFGIRPIDIATPGVIIYQASVDLGSERDVEFPIPEGVGVRLKWHGYINPFQIDATLLSYDPVKIIMFFETEQFIPKRLYNSYFKVIPWVDELIAAVKGRLIHLPESIDTLAQKLLDAQVVPECFQTKASSQSSGLDSAQRDAITKCLNQDITYIWGPPGTGKTLTLAHLIVEITSQGKRVLAVTTANVAIDQLAKHFIGALDRLGAEGSRLLSEGRILRFGHPEVTDEPRLFPNKEEIQKLRSHLHKALERQRHIPQDQASERAVIQQEINKLRSRIREITKETISRARVIFTTTTQICIESAFWGECFNTVVVDEASMISIPQLLCMAMSSEMRFVVAGDFRQLGPIALARSQKAYDWLHRDGFNLVGITNDLRSPLVTMLTNQRRMHCDICALINRYFYDGKLTTSSELESIIVQDLPQIPNRAAVFVSFLESDGSQVEPTLSGSRRNQRSAEFVAKLAIDYAHLNPDFRIAIVAPYRAQVGLLKSLLRQYSHQETITERILIGTVHAFQGAEADIVIWDLVETRHHPIGLLYRSETGNRLANVAISRAKGKLLIVGDKGAFAHAPSADAVGHLKNILQWRFSEEQNNIVKAADISF